MLSFYIYKIKTYQKTARKEEDYSLKISYLLKLLIAIFSLILITACNSNSVDSPRGFSLPNGNPEQGKVVFKEKQCLSCHSINSVTDDSIEKELTTPLHLGGEVSLTKTYAELVTSIINPSHKISKSYKSEAYQSDGKSNMKNYNAVLSVEQLIDLVAFLQPHYQLMEYEETTYDIYP